MAELFKFSADEGITFTKAGQPINGIKSSLWVERYAEPGEFEILAPISSDLRRFLPLGTLISHVRTTEVMMVENHEVTQTRTDESALRITGRSFTAFMEQRVAGANMMRAGDVVTPYEMSSRELWDQIGDLIDQHLITTFDPEDDIDNVTLSIAGDVTAGPSTTEARTIERGDLLRTVTDLLAVDDLGIKAKRTTDGSINIVIYKGDDKRSSVIFSWISNDLETANYLYSNKSLKNTAMVVGRYLWTVVDTTGKNNYDRRMLMVDATDIDGNLDTIPTGGTRTNLLARMGTRGREKLRRQNHTVITDADVSNLTHYRFREDYNLGDLVLVEGDYNQKDTKRIVEYAEIMDENGHSEHPTLGDPNPDES